MANNKSKSSDADQSKSNFRRSDSRKRSKRRPSNYKDPKRNQEIEGSNDRRVGLNNDFSWYNRYPSALSPAAKLSFGWPGSYPFKVDGFDFYNHNGLHKMKGIPLPSIMRIHFTPVPGISTNLSSAVNRAARNLFTFVRSKNSRVTGYEASDLMMYVLAVDSLNMAIAEAKRAYGAIRFTTPLNRAYPKAVLAALDWDFFDLQTRQADFASQLNTYILRAQAFPIPANIAACAKHEWMVSNIYTDRDDPRAQLYVFIPQGHWVFDELYDTATPSQYTGSRLDWTPTSSMNASTDPINATGWKIDAYFGLLEKMLTALEQSESVANMISDLRKTETQLYVPDFMDPSHTVIPGYNSEVLGEIQNMRATGLMPINDTIVKNDPTNFCIYQTVGLNNSGIIFNPVLNSGAGETDVVTKKEVNQYAPVVGFYNGLPSEEEIVTNTRFVSVAASDRINEYPRGFRLLTAGTEIINCFSVMTPDDTNPERIIWDGNLYYTNMISTTKNTEFTDKVALRMANTLSNFDWHPYLFHFTDDDSGDLKFDGVLGEFNNAGCVPVSNLQLLNDVCIFSEWAVPASDVM